MATLDNLILGDLHGSINGVTFYGSPGHQKARMKTAPNPRNSFNLNQSQSDLAYNSASWQLLDAGTKHQWQLFAAGNFHSRSGKTSPTTSGYFAYVASYKLLYMSSQKIINFDYQFSLGTIQSVTAIPINPSLVNSIGYPGYLNISRNPSMPILMTLSKIEMRNDNFVKFRVSFPNTPVIPPGPTQWAMVYKTTPPPQVLTGSSFQIYASDCVRYLDSPPINYYQYFIGSLGTMTNAITGFVNSQYCDFTCDCSPICALNYIFSGRNAFLWLTISYITFDGIWISFPSVCVNKVDAFSW